MLLPRSKLLGSLGLNKGYLGVLRDTPGISGVFKDILGYAGVYMDIQQCALYSYIQEYHTIFRGCSGLFRDIHANGYGVNILGIGRRFPVVLPPIMYTSCCRAHQKLSIKGKILSKYCNAANSQMGGGVTLLVRPMINFYNARAVQYFT